jgi:hypothetical protein
MTKHLSVRRPRTPWPATSGVATDALARLLAKPPLPRHVVLVLVQQLDRSVTRSIRYARSLRPDVVRGLHIVVDPVEAERLAREWERLGLSRLTLELRDAPDRRLDRALLEAAFEEMDGRTHASIVVPRRLWRPRWWALLAHDRSATGLVRAVTHLHLHHLTVTVVPFAIGDPDGDSSVRDAQVARP